MTEAEIKRAYRCKTCIRVSLEANWTCRGCGRKMCHHAMRVQRLDGTGLCRKCAWARTRKLNERAAVARVSSPLAAACAGVRETP